MRDTIKPELWDGAPRLIALYDYFLMPSCSAPTSTRTASGPPAAAALIGQHRRRLAPGGRDRRRHAERSAPVAWPELLDDIEHRLADVERGLTTGAVDGVPLRAARGPRPAAAGAP